MTLYFYAACLAGILMVTSFVFSVILVPAWNWVSTVPAAIGKTASGIFAASSPTPKPIAGNNQQIASTATPAAVIITTEKTPKPADCERVIKQLKAGKAVSLPPECEQTYQAFKDREQAKLEEARLKEEARQRELDREKEERENGQKLEFEREQELAREREKERQRQEAEQARAASIEREQKQREADDRRRQEAREDAARREARSAAEERERTRQREQQKRNEAIIQAGKEIKKIFKKGN